ncbi:hypothetical protein BJF79_07350 [Actinomadura sp. CNU-125]|uniref:hypothetical protein n=1 Tax=Actinomadura sp. CNU-125 TaxID=1904961 RepID=UPI0009657AB3|nr:hypothetical protein [Actinomadura sp. CNU-125]OLT34377.1 hypothetical protein BJF79_07350 [Actinomadura sp. CNU-125]
MTEAELVGVYRNLNVIYVADFNAAAAGEKPDTNGLDPHRAARKSDDRPARELDLSGFTDVGAHMTDPTPTVGHTRDDPLKVRCDRQHTTLPHEAITGYGVVVAADDLSDHRPVWAEYTLE